MATQGQSGSVGREVVMDRRIARHLAHHLLISSICFQNKKKILIIDLETTCHRRQRLEYLKLFMVTALIHMYDMLISYSYRLCFILLLSNIMKTKQDLEAANTCRLNKKYRIYLLCLQV